MVKTKQILILIFMVSVLVFSACGPASPAATEAASGACPTPAPGVQLLTNAEEGYCLLYPAEYSTEIPDYIVINPISGAGDIPGDAWVSIDVENAAGRSAAQVAETAIAEAGEGFNITRTETTVDGEPAVIVDGLPGTDSLRRVFIVHEDRLYTLTFMPWIPNADAEQAKLLENLYSMILETLRFLPSNP